MARSPSTKICRRHFPASGQTRPGFSSLVSFGDSLSDVGTYQVGTVAALGGGKFTVNGSGARIWTEKLASTVHVAAPCPAQKGLLPNIWDKFKDGLINMFKEEDDRHL